MEQYVEWPVTSLATPILHQHRRCSEWAAHQAADRASEDGDRMGLVLALPEPLDDLGVLDASIPLFPVRGLSTSSRLFALAADQPFGPASQDSASFLYRHGGCSETPFDSLLHIDQPRPRRKPGPVARLLSAKSSGSHAVSDRPPYFQFHEISTIRELWRRCLRSSRAPWD